MKPIYEMGGEGQVVHLAVANGFPAQTYLPLVQPLTEHYRVLSLPPRALWSDEKPPEELVSWRMLADDLLAGLEEHDLRDVIAIGHSFGGIASLLAAIDNPERFHALILLDPTILPPSTTVHEAVVPLVQGALRRKQHWQDVDDAFEYFRGRPLFEDWSDEAVRLYAEQGTCPANDGRELIWSAEWEAYYFSTIYTDTWEDVMKLKTPVLVVRGGGSDTFRPEAAEQLRGLLPDMAYAEVPGFGHMFPQAAPDATRQIITDWLAGLGA